MRPSAKTSIFAPTRCGVEPVVDDDGHQRRRLAALERLGDGREDFLVHCCDYTSGRCGQVGRRAGLAGPGAEPAATDCLRQIGAARTTRVGSVPARNASWMTRGQPGVASLPVSRSMSTK